MFLIKTHQEIKNGKAEHFKGDAHVAVIIEPVQHLDAEATKERETKTF
jgi:hypothetical protein